MGTAHTSKSTRAHRARSVRTPPKPPRQPATPQGSKLNTAAEAVHDARDQRADAILKAARAAEPAFIATDPYRKIWHSLRIARAVVHVSAAALEAQRADADIDVAATLRLVVGEQLERQLNCIERLIRRKAP
jgi:hypothetical protein